MDKMSKDSKAKLLKYRGEIEILKMGFCDAILVANKCGAEIRTMHEETMEELRKRKLQVNKDKCVRMHIAGRKAKNTKCEELCVDSWSVEKKETDSGIILQDVYNGKHKIKTVNSYEYLGSFIENTGSNKETINDRVGKGQGAIRDIQQILNKCFFGAFFIEAL